MVRRRARDGERSSIWIQSALMIFYGIPRVSCYIVVVQLAKFLSPPPHTINVSMVSLIFVTIWRNLVGIGIKLYPNAIHFHTYSIYIGVFIYFPISFDKSRSL